VQVYLYVCINGLGWIDVLPSFCELVYLVTTIYFLIMSWITLMLLYFLILTYLVTHSMDQSPSWVANRFSASQEVTWILWNPTVHYRVYKCRPTVPILSQTNPVQAPTSHFLKINPNIKLPCRPGSSNWSLYLSFPHQKPICTSPSPIRATSPTISIFPIRSPEYHLAKSTDHEAAHYVFFLHLPVTSSLLGRNILLSTLFSNILSLRFFINVSNQVSHPYKTTGKIIVLYILNLKSLDSKLEDKKFCPEF
jgi:hypothetical protein